MARSWTRIVLVAFLLGGCVHKVHIESTPPGAMVSVGGRNIGATPLDRTLVWWPFRRVPIKVKLPGHRPATADLARPMSLRRGLADLLLVRWRLLAGLRPRHVHTVVLVRTHGRAGTWTPEEAQGQ